MIRIIGAACALLVGLAGPASAQAAKAAQETKTVQGTVASVSGDSLTVKVDGKDMTFKVDSKTHTTAPGGGTKTRAAQAEGKTGPTLAEVVKVGQGVEVAYHESGMHAASVRVMSAPPGAPKDPATQSHTASGVVSSVSASSLTVKAAAGDLTFAIDSKTTVVGTGLGTASRKAAEAGTKTPVTDFVHQGDAVSVTYHESGGTKQASSVRVTTKAK
jgi:hypothetical protein